MIAPQAPVQLTIQGRALVMSALTDADEAELDAWCGQRMIQLAARAADTPDDYDRLVGLAMREAVKVTWRSSGMMRKPNGFAHLMWVSLRRQQVNPPTKDEVVQLLAAADTKENMMLSSTWRLLNTEPTRPTSPGQEKPGNDSTGAEPTPPS